MSVDPFTFEIIRHKFMRVIDEAVITLKHISGSSATTEGHDLIGALYRADGSLLMGVTGYLHALPGAGEACRHILREYAESPGIYDGDVFLLNDPYIAALHSSDTYVISPIFYEGTLVAWSANFVHLRDIGAINPGGFAPDSREIYHEGIMCPGIKLMERGVLRKDVWKTLLNMVRTPEIVALDLHSQIAANITAKERLVELIRKYGPDTIDEVAQGIIDQSEALLRSRLKELPDGTWRARQYLEALGEIYTVNLAMTKQDDSLRYDFTGTSKQAPVAFNSTYWGTLGALFAPLFPLLGYDMTWNDGMLKAVTMYAPEGTLVNCTRPAPNALATISGIEVVNNVSLEALSKMLAASEKYRKEATAVWLGAHSPMTVCGYKENRYVVGMLTDEFGGSGGARTFKDGVDFGGEIPNPLSRTPNIENEERNVPILYLFRRLLPDSGGGGQFRGGMSGEYAFTAHRATNGRVDVVLYGRGTEYTQCQGFFGGHPGCNCGYVLFRNSEVYESFPKGGLPDDLKQVSGSQEPVVWGTYELKEGDMLLSWVMGGGGYGDPLERDPEAVRADVAQGLVSPEWAREVYGVVLREGAAVDLEATRRLREEMVRLRLRGWEKASAASRRGKRPAAEADPARDASGEAGGYNLSENLKAVKTSKGTDLRCAKCGHRLSRAEEHWKDRVVVVRSSLTRSGPRRSESERFEMRQYLCPGCGRLLDTEVALPGDPPLHDEVKVPL
ncbi:MAG: hydantoinase B/oxoprolinase family protein [Candidatus Tectomicrobia bacterium]|nr:hydantoinase B/oxoprolinase family protein [Candidatus Tectomicrobia bacterium]